ncbi:MAG: DUF6596 domain-containing protein [Pseudomonadota bacterium]
MTGIDQTQDRAALDRAARQNYGKLLASLVKFCGDFDLAEDGLQEAMTRAAEKWPKGGKPRNENSWLITVARNCITDHLRKDFRSSGQLEFDEIPGPDNNVDGRDDRTEFKDERLGLIFMCCHPALESSMRVALTLKSLCGLSTRQIAAVFLQKETTMAQRIVRAKRKIRKSGISFSDDSGAIPLNRLDDVLAVIYFVFNEGYYSISEDRLIDTSLCEEAVFLARMLCQLMPLETEPRGLLALMYFHQARESARQSIDGHTIEMHSQNRSAWDRAKITTADRVLRGVLMRGRPGPYQIQAAISALHCHAPSFEETDWQQIKMLYLELLRHTDTPVVHLNLCVAIRYADSPEQAYDYLCKFVDPDPLNEYLPYHLTKGRLQLDLSDFKAAEDSLTTALGHCRNQREETHIRSLLNQPGVASSPSEKP